MTRQEAMQAPPEGELLTIRVLDKWRGNGREDEVINGYYSNDSFLTDTGKTIPSCLVAGWGRGGMKNV